MQTNVFLSNKSKAIIACLLATIMSLGFTACSEIDDNPVVNPLNSRIVGTWYSELDGTDAEAPGKLVQALEFSEDGTGSFYQFFIDKDNEVMDRGGDVFGVGFNYTTSISGDIKLTMKNVMFGNPDTEDMDVDLHYANGAVMFDAADDFGLKPATEPQIAQLQMWAMSRGKGAVVDNYNINDADFTPETWRQQDAIYVYDGKGPVSDSRGEKGYTLVPLPWSDLPVQTNLPYGFCNTITPEKGWEWVYNLCGNNSLINGNFFAVYNKYTGILRFFYYMPENFSAGNDHVWQVSMTDNMAQQSLWGYGLPSLETIKDRRKIAPTGSGTMVNYVATWVEMKTGDGLIMPNAGWWAFDVDLSLYRPGVDISKDAIKLQMRSWSIHHVSLFSTMTASIDGSMKQKVKESESSSASTAKGVMIGLKAAAGVASSIAHFYSGDYGNALGAIGNLFGCGSELAGLYGEKKDEPFEGEISLGMNGTISTDGFIKDAVPTVGVASPTIQMKDFNMNDSHFGQGVWNIKHFPKVYVVKDAKHDYTVNTGHPIQEYFVSFPYFFDPRNIELQLNPEVFPDNDIEWVKVDATCGVAAATGIGGTDSQRTGFGLKSRNLGMSNEDIPTKWTTGSSLENVMSQYGYPAAYDYLFYENKKGNTSYPVKVCETGQKSNHSREYVIGRGIKNSHAIEPALVREIPPYSYSASYPIMVPDLEVNVTVIVKLRSMNEPIVLSRNYLPEFEAITIAQMQPIAKELYDRPSGSIYTYNRERYDYQSKRINNIYGLVKSF